MATMTRRTGVIAGLTTALLGIAIAIPFTIIHPVLPFTILLMGFGIFLLVRQRLRLPTKYPTAYLAGCLAALLLLLPAVSIIKFVEQGFNDGPFFGANYTGGVTGLEVSHRTDYRDGELLIYNRQKNSAPVLIYEVNDNIRWGRELDIRDNAKYEGYLLSDVASPTIAYGILRDRVDFLGTWEFGQEPGRAYLWKWGGFHCFYLSW